MSNNYYPLKRVRDKLPQEEQIIATPTDKNGWSYFIADNEGDWLTVTTNRQHSITSISFTRRYKGLGLSLKRARKKGFRICRYLGLASWEGKSENVN